MIARLLSPAASHPAVRLRKPAYLTAPDIVVVVVVVVVRGSLGNRGEGGMVCVSVCVCVERGSRKGMDRRERDREKPKGKSASINNQVTPGALQLLELPQRDANVSGIASVNL